jgi:hypothetical protein
VSDLPGPLDPHRGGCADGWTSCSNCPVILCEYNTQGENYRKGRRKMKQIELPISESGQESQRDGD